MHNTFETRVIKGVVLWHSPYGPEPQTELVNHLLDEGIDLGTVVGYPSTLGLLRIALSINNWDAFYSIT